MAGLLRVRDWAEKFENNRTKEIKDLKWVPTPNKHDGDGYTELVEHENGAAHFGCWNAIVQVASKCEPRGTLLRDTGKPHDSASLARMTRLPEPMLREAIERLIVIGWLESEVVGTQGVESIPAMTPQDGAAITQEPALNGMEWNGMEEKEHSARASRIPTLQEVRDYFTEKKIDIDPEEFFNHYESADWKRGKSQTPITKWKLCVSTWLKKRGHDPGDAWLAEKQQGTSNG